MDKSRKSFREFLELSENKKGNHGKRIDGTEATHGSDVEGAEDYKIQRKSQKGQNMAPRKTHRIEQLENGKNKMV